LEKQRGSDEKLIDCHFVLASKLKEACGGDIDISNFLIYITGINLKVTSTFILLEIERKIFITMVLYVWEVRFS
jgi:hypothetical protein